MEDVNSEYIFNSVMERGNLDFVEQIWVRMWKSECNILFLFQKYKFINICGSSYKHVSMTGVTSDQDVHDCLKLVIDSLSYGYVKPWVCGLRIQLFIRHQQRYLCIGGER